MSCQSIGPLLDGYYDGELGSIERWRVQRHLGGCAVCRDEFARLARVGGWVREAVGPAREPDLWGAIAQQLPVRDRTPRRVELRSAPLRPRLRKPIAAAIAAAGFAGAYWFATPDTGRLASLPGTSGMVRSIYAKERPVMVLESQNSDEPTIIWLMDEVGEQAPEVSESVGI